MDHSFSQAPPVVPPATKTPPNSKTTPAAKAPPGPKAPTSATKAPIAANRPAQRTGAPPVASAQPARRRATQAVAPPVPAGPDLAALRNFMAAGNANNDDGDEDDEDVLGQLGPAPSNAVVPNNQQPAVRDNTAYLKAVWIPKTEGGGHIVIRLHPTDPENKRSTWPEKIMMDGIFNREAWLSRIPFVRLTYAWYDNNIEQKNARDYAYRLFLIPSRGTLTAAQIVAILRRLARGINEQPTNNIPVMVNPDDAFWLQDIVPVWSDVIGSNAAFQRLTSMTGLRTDTNFYQEHENVIHEHFRRGTFTLDMARALNAPLEQVHPGARATAAGIPPEAENQEYVDLALDEDDEDSDEDMEY